MTDLRRMPLAVISVLVMCTVVASCTKATPESSARFQLHVLDISWGDPTDPDLGYTRDTAWPVLKNLDWEQSSIWTITEQDIELYDWNQQTITLTVEATTDLRQAFDDDALSRWMIGQAFVVTCDGDWVYGGVFYLPEGAAGIDFPAIYLQYSEREQAVLVLRSSHARCLFVDHPRCVSDLQYPEIRVVFAKHNKLVE
jgi:hypothetical protein